MPRVRTESLLYTTYDMQRKENTGIAGALFRSRDDLVFERAGEEEAGGA